MTEIRIINNIKRNVNGGHRNTDLLLHLVDHILDVDSQTLKFSLLGVLLVDETQGSIKREEIVHVEL